jgi:general secretion pathway protein M
MRQWFEQLAPRERLILGAGAVIVLILVLYAVIWSPLVHDVERLEASLEEQSRSAAWMRQAAREVSTLNRGASGGSASDGRPLLTLVEQTARTAGLGAALNRVEPQGSGTAGVWLQNAAFDDLINWLGQIDAELGVRVDSMVADPQDTPGRVNVRLVLSRGDGP